MLLHSRYRGKADLELWGASPQFTKSYEEVQMGGILAVGILGTLLVISAPVLQAQTPQQPRRPQAGNIENGKNQFKARGCVSCHSYSGQGGRRCAPGAKPDHLPGVSKLRAQAKRCDASVREPNTGSGTGGHLCFFKVGTAFPRSEKHSATEPNRLADC